MQPVTAIRRLQDAKVLAAGMAPHAAALVGYDPEEMSGPNNIVLTNGEDSFTVFEKTDIDGCYASHHFHPTQVRGRNALRISGDMLEYLFSNFPQVQILRGFTEKARKDACWAARQLGFKDKGDITLMGRQCTIFILTRRDFDGGGL